MNVREQSIAECPTCSSLITTAHLTGRVKSMAGAVMVPVECRTCGLALSLRYTPHQWGVITDHVRRQATEERERIGRTVAEFRRVDLAVVDSVEDILPFWGLA